MSDRPIVHGTCPGCKRFRSIRARGLCHGCWKTNSAAGADRRRSGWERLDPAARNRAVLDPAQVPPGAVRALAFKVARRFGPLVDYRDLVQEAYFALLRGHAAHRGTNGATLFSFCYPHMRMVMYRYAEKVVRRRPEAGAGDLAGVTECEFRRRLYLRRDMAGGRA